MPIYEYQCASCGTVFDSLQKMSDPDPDACPQCDKPQISRRVTAPSFRLAGSGWYETDFKSGSDKKRNIAGDSAPSSAESAPGKTDSPSSAAVAPAAPATAAPASKPDAS